MTVPLAHIYAMLWEKLSEMKEILLHMNMRGGGGGGVAEQDAAAVEKKFQEYVGSVWCIKNYEYLIDWNWCQERTLGSFL